MTHNHRAYYGAMQVTISIENNTVAIPFSDQVLIKHKATNGEREREKKKKLQVLVIAIVKIERD